MDDIDSSALRRIFIHIFHIYKIVLASTIIMNNFCPLPIQPLAPPRPSQISPDRTSLRRQHLRTTAGAQPGIHPTDTQSF